MSGLQDIERRFVDRTISPEDEALLIQQCGDGRFVMLKHQRAMQDRKKQFARLGDEVARVVPMLNQPLGDNQGWPEIAMRLGQGLALLIEEIHHLNGGALNGDR